ncbi:MAG: type II toxin-antitoxin system HicB family antitoxin [Patescibacteria group bacterium]
MKKQFTVVYKKRGKWYVGWVEEVPGANSQAKTLKGLKENLNEALSLVLKSNRSILEQELGGKLVRESLVVSY